MLNVKMMILGQICTNCYIVWKDDSNNCVIIDPGFQPEDVLNQVQELGKKVEAVLLTHGHWDHVGGAEQIAKAVGCPIYIHKIDIDPSLFRGKRIQADTYEEGDVLQLAGTSFRVMHTPGHTAGCVCLVADDCLFSGDTLFAGTCGRTDLPTSDPEAMRLSLRRLADLEGDYRVFPGHGNGTMLSDEREYNFFMRALEWN